MKIINKTSISKTIFLLTFFTLLLSFNNLASAVVLDSRTSTKNQPIQNNLSINDDDNKHYAPNEIIVKFKPEAANTLEQQITQKGSAPAMVQLAVSLDTLNKKYGVKNLAPIFKNFKGERKRIERLKTKDNFKTKYNLKTITFTEKEQRLLKRLKRAPKDAKVPDLSRIYKLQLEEGQSVEEAVAEYQKDPNVEYAQPNYINELYATPLPREPYIPNDYYIEDDQNPGYWRQGSWGQTYPDLWGLQKIQLIEAHNLFDTNGNGIFDIGETKPGEGVIVAVIDTGVDYNHEDIKDNIWINEDEIPENGIDDDGNGYVDDIRGYDFAYSDNNPMDGNGHGTHVSGTIAAIGNNNKGIIGVAPNAKIMAVKGFPDFGYGDITDLAEGIRYAAYNGADVLNNSWGPVGRRPSNPIAEEAIDYAYALGCVIVFAAGNGTDDVAYYSPANYPKTIAVAATDHRDNKASFSNYGELIDVAAPGGDSYSDDGPDGPDTWKLGRNILSLRAAGTDMYGEGDPDYGLPTGICLVPQFDDTAKYYRSRGTSMACPHVAGLAALLFSVSDSITNEGARYIMRYTADGVGNPTIGTGRINAYNAISLIKNDAKPPTIDAVHIRPDVKVVSGNNVMEGVVMVTWHTDEPSTSKVYYGTTSLDIYVTLSAYTTEHSVIIDGLDINTEYIFAVESADFVEHTVYNDNGGGYYRSIIIPPDAINVTPLELVFEIPEGGTLVTGTAAIHNPSVSGTCDLLFEISNSSQWLSVSPQEGRLPSSSSMDVTVYIDPARLSAGVYTDTIVIRNNVLTNKPIEISVTLNIIPAPAIAYRCFNIIDDWSGRSFMVNGDKRLNPGERIELQIQVENFGSLTAQEASAKLSLSAPDQYVSILDDTITLGDIAPHTMLLSQKSFLIKADNSTPDSHIVTFLLDITDENGHLWHKEFKMGVYILSSGPTTLDDIRLDTDAAGVAKSGSCKISCDNTGHIYVAWGDGRNGEYDIYFNSSADYGITWQTQDVRLDTDEPGSRQSQLPNICSDNTGHVHVVWEEFPSGDVYFNCSEDYGITWKEEAMRLDTGASFPPTNSNPSIGCDELGHVYVVWEDNKSGAAERDVYFNYSMDYGRTWQQNDIQLNRGRVGTRFAMYPKVICDASGHVYAVWGEAINSIGEGWVEIYFNYSADYGATWQEQPIMLSTDEAGGAPSFWPEIDCDDNGHVYVAWGDWRNSSNYFGDIYFNYSADYGATWQENVIRLDTDSPGAADSSYHQIRCDENGHIYVAWDDNRNGKYDIYFNRSMNYGATWQTQDMRLDTDVPGVTSSFYPKIECDNTGRVYVAWLENFDTCFNYSTDYGIIWQNQTLLLNTDPPQSGQSSRSIGIDCDSKGDVYVTWADYRNGKNDIYFRPLSISITGEIPRLDLIEDREITEMFSLEFVVKATGPEGKELELFFDPQGLPKELQDELSTATFEASFNEETGETTGTFKWTPDSSSQGTYYPVVFVARDALGRCAYQAITIKVLDVVLPGESIQEAVNNASADDIIYISQGEYTENVILKEGVSLIGVGDTPVIVNGKVKMANNSSIEGITFNYKLKDGEKDPNFNYSILHINSSDVTVKDCNFNLSYNGLSPLYQYTSIASISGDNITLEGNTFTFTTSNSYYYIYGLRIGLQTQTSNITLKGNTIDIEDTTPSRMYYIYGVYAYRTDNLILENNIINTKSKTARYGLYGLTCYSPSGIGNNTKVKNNTIYLKTEHPSPWYIMGIYSYQVPHINIRNNIIDLPDAPRTSYPKPVYIYGYNTSTSTSTDTSTDTNTDTDTDTNTDIKVTYNIYDKTNTFIYKYPSSLAITQHDNIKANPEFKDPENKDFHLLLTSPAIDKGAPLDDYSNEPEPNGDRINCGRYGNTEEATVTPRIINVPQDYSTINGAITASDYGTIIYIKEGTYQENIILPDGVYLIGQGRDKTTVNGKISIGSDCLIKGITFKYNIPDSNPHTLANIQSSNTIVRDCSFNLTYNGSSYMSYYNYIAYLKGDNITLENNTFSFTTSNSYYYTRGIYGSLCTNATLKNNRIDIIDNSLLRGYYIYPVSLMHPQNLIFENNIIYAKANNAYGIYGLTLATFNAMYDNALIKNNTIYLKTNRIATVYYLTGIYTSQLAKLNIRNNIIDLPDRDRAYYPRAVYIYGSGLSSTDISFTYNIYKGSIYKYPSTLTITEHDNIIADPQFINPAVGDFHLLSTSPAIDKGDPLDAYYLEPKPNGNRINCGSYGNTKEATTSP